LNNIIQSGLYSDYLSLAEDLMEEEKPDKILAALLKYSFEDELDPSSYNEIRDVLPKIPGQTRLFIARGRKSGMTPKKLTKFISERTEIQSKKIKDIVIQEDFSFINVPFKEAEIILRSFKRRKNGKRPLVEKAKPRKQLRIK
jgi:ATP-dependent RNA helicase DeaD